MAKIISWIVISRERIREIAVSYTIERDDIPKAVALEKDLEEVLSRYHNYGACEYISHSD